MVYKAMMTMAHLTPEEQHNGRNSVQCLEGFILKLRKSDRITQKEKEMCFRWLEKISAVFDNKEDHDNNSKEDMCCN